MEIDDIFVIIHNEINSFANKYRILPNALMINTDFLKVLQQSNEFRYSVSSINKPSSIMGLTIYKSMEPMMCKVALIMEENK